MHLETGSASGPALAGSHSFDDEPPSVVGLGSALVLDTGLPRADSFFIQGSLNDLVGHGLAADAERPFDATPGFDRQVRHLGQLLVLASAYPWSWSTMRR